MTRADVHPKPLALTTSAIGASDDLEATILRPAPMPSHRPPPSHPSTPTGDAPDSADDALAPALASTRNRLLAAATPLLNCAIVLRHHPSPDDAATLRRRLLDALRAFDRRAAAGSVAAAHRPVGRYILCTLLDETIARSAWAAAADWTRQGLLVTLHQESFGGERFFTIADHALRDPGRHVDLLELMAVVLALGFEGRYALVPDGRRRLEDCRDRLHAAVRSLRGDADGRWPPSLPARRTTARPDRSAGRRLGVAAAALTVAVAVFALDRWHARRIDLVADGIAARLEALRPVPLPAATEPSLPAPRLAERLRPLLMAEILAGQVEVDEDASRAHVTLVGDRCYASGDAELRADLQPVLARIARALDQVRGAIVVAGHTDDRPVRAGGAFATNEALSLERARQVARRLSSGLADPSRLQVVGLADRQPRSPNDTEAGRARNRRIEITLEEEAPGVALDR
jgi:type VI secretion system protein ImpK